MSFTLGQNGQATDKSFASPATMDILQRGLTQALRHDHGLIYEVGVDAREVDRDRLHTWLTADALPEQLPVAAHVLLSTLETLATTGAREDELAAYRRRVEDASSHPRARSVSCRARPAPYSTG